ncbi:unnamed protein product [Amoebophrya sp. A120]|nr:unnamed protein product [Amoebophrya sp. A120]|eukprot:GSA120T00020414001.1
MSAKVDHRGDLNYLPGTSEIHVKYMLDHPLSRKDFARIQNFVWVLDYVVNAVGIGSKNGFDDFAGFFRTSSSAATRTNANQQGGLLQLPFIPNGGDPHRNIEDQLRDPNSERRFLDAELDFKVEERKLESLSLLGQFVGFLLLDPSFESLSYNLEENLQRARTFAHNPNAGRNHKAGYGNSLYVAVVKMIKHLKQTSIHRDSPFRGFRQHGGRVISPLKLAAFLTTFQLETPALSTKIEQLQRGAERRSYFEDRRPPGADEIWRAINDPDGRLGQNRLYSADPSSEMTMRHISPAVREAWMLGRNPLLSNEGIFGLYQPSGLHLSLFEQLASDPTRVNPTWQRLPPNIRHRFEQLQFNYSLGLVKRFKETVWTTLLQDFWLVIQDLEDRKEEEGRQPLFNWTDDGPNGNWERNIPDLPYRISSKNRREFVNILGRVYESDAAFYRQVARLGVADADGVFYTGEAATLRTYREEAGTILLDRSSRISIQC